MAQHLFTYAAERGKKRKKVDGSQLHSVFIVMYEYIGGYH